MRKYNLFGVNYVATDYIEATEEIISHASNRDSYGVVALPVHGLIEAYRNSEFMECVNKVNMALPDGHPVRWALNSFYKLGLKDRVYGPTLALYVLKKAAEKKLNVYLYGSRPDTLLKFSKFISSRYPSVKVCGLHEDRCREATPEEDKLDIMKINNSNANIVFVGRGCPRQELWVANHLGLINAVMIAIGAGFDFHAGVLKQAPKWMQDRGLEWLFRLLMEPKRLWKRYLITNTIFIYLFMIHKYFLKRPF